MKDNESVYAQIFEQLLEHIDSVPDIGMMTSKEMAIHAISLEDKGWTVNENNQLVNVDGTTYLEAFGPKGIGLSDESPLT